MRRCKRGELGQRTLEVLWVLQGAPGPMTMRGLAKLLGISKQAVPYHLGRLNAAGLVVWERERAQAFAANCRFVPADQL